MKRVLYLGVIFLLCMVVEGREWTLRDGRKVEGEVLKCSAKSLTLRTSQKKTVTVKFDELSAEDIALLEKNYGGVYEGGGKKGGSRGEENEREAMSEKLSAQSPYPIVKLSNDDIGLVMNTSNGKFSTKHFSFKMKSQIDNDEARDLALQSEIVYESVMTFPFWPDSAKRFYSELGGGQNKFPIEIGNVKIANSIGAYSYTYDRSGNLVGECVTVLPKYAKYCRSLAKLDLRLPLGVFAHEITHMLLANADLTCALTEGIAVYTEVALFNKTGELNFTDIDGFLRASSLAEGFAQYCGRIASKENAKEISSTIWRYHYIKSNKIKYAGGLKKFLLLPQKNFVSSAKAANNYNGAFLLYHYFIKSKPEVLKKFLTAAAGNGIDGKGEARVKGAFDILLDGKKESELEAEIVAFYKDYGITVEF